MAEPKRDRYGRYLLTHPESGREVAWMRATTLADTVEDKYNIEKWKMRSVLYGAGQRPDLMALARASDMEDKKALDDLAEQAMAAAGANEKSNKGTALHKFTERLDKGQRVNAPEEYQPDVDAYQALLTRKGIETHPAYIERITVVPQLVVAGTIDRIVRYKGTPYVGDLKTGQELKYSWGKIAIQLAIYAHGYGLWNEDNGTYERMPAVDQNRGLVMHVPAGSGTAELWWVDIAAGWDAAVELCFGTRSWRKRKDLATKVED